MNINETTKKPYFKDLPSSDFEGRIYGSHEFHSIKNQIEIWSKTGTGINSNAAHKIVDAIVDLCIEVKNHANKPDFLLSEEERSLQALKNMNEILKSAAKQQTIHYNYTSPIQTGIAQWSVFVRKMEGDTVHNVIEHKFDSYETANDFARNNWSLGDYF